MKKKRYVKPDIELVELEGDGFLRLSYAVEDKEDGEDYIIPPTMAGSGEWTETDDGRDDHPCGDLD